MAAPAPSIDRRRRSRNRPSTRLRALLGVCLALALLELAQRAEASAAVAAAAAAAVDVAAGEALNSTAAAGGGQGGSQHGKGASGSRLPRWLGFGTASHHQAPLACRLRGRPAPFDVVEVYRQLTDCRGLPSPSGHGHAGSIASAAAERLRTKEKVAMVLRWMLSCFWAMIKASGRFWYNALFCHPTTLLIWGIGTFVVFVAIHIWLAAGSARQISSLAAFEDMSDGTGLYEAEFELESDEYEFEDDSEAEQPTDPLMAKPLRRAFSLSSGHRRKGSDGQVKRPPSSMVRITSSDPSSTLSTAPIHLELDRFGGRTTSASPFRGASAARRREGGRLLAGGQAAASSSGRQSPASGRQSPGSPTRPSRPPRIRPVSQLRSPRKGGAALMSEESSSSSTSVAAVAARAASPSSQASDMPGLTSSYSSESQASADADHEYRFVDAAEGEPELPEKPLPAPEGPPSILKRRPETFGGIPHVPLSSGPYPSSSGGFTSMGMPWETRSDGHLSYDGMPELGNGQKQGESAIDGMPLGYPGMAPLPSVTSGTSGSLPPGAAHAPGTALAQAAPVGPAPKLGSLTPAQIRAAWPVKRQKRIRLVEPDWAVHADTHDRARERLETAAAVATHPDPLSLEYMPPSRGSAIWDDENDEGDEARCSEFWFERYTQSTAAAGRDWDWRKRRARRRAEAAAAGRPYLSSSTISLPAGVGAGDGAGTAGVPVQQDRGPNSARIREARQRIAKQAPLISFTAEELSPKLQPLSVDTSLTGSPRGGTSDSGTPSSPLNRAIRSLRSSSYSGPSGAGSPPSSPKVEPPHVLGSVSGDGRSSPNGSVRQRMGKMMRRSTLGDGEVTAFPTLSATSATSSVSVGGSTGAVRQRRHSDMELAGKPADGDADESLSVPSRLSSLKPRGRLNSLRDSKRDAAVSTAAGAASLTPLLTQPITPANGDSRINLYRDGLSTAGLRSPGDEAPAPPSLIYADNSTQLPSYPRSSADAYGSLSMQVQQVQQLHDEKLKQGQLPDIPDEADAEEDDEGPRWWEEMETDQPDASKDSLRGDQSNDTFDTLSTVREESFDSPLIDDASIAPIVHEPETGVSTPPRHESQLLDGSPGSHAKQGLSSNGMLTPTYGNGDSVHRTTSQTSSASTTNSSTSTPRKRPGSSHKRQSNGVASSRSSTGSGSSPNRRAGGAKGAGAVGDPPVVRITPRSGSRKGILAGTVDNDLAARTRHARAPALQKAAAEATSRHPRPMEQPEPAPTAMASRARSASLSSQSSTPSKDTMSSAGGGASYLSGGARQAPYDMTPRSASLGATSIHTASSTSPSKQRGQSRPSSSSSAASSSSQAQDGASGVPRLPYGNAIRA